MSPAGVLPSVRPTSDASRLTFAKQPFVPKNGSSSSGSATPADTVLLRPSTTRPIEFGAWLVEVVVTEDSPLNGSTIRRARFADEYGLFVLAIHRGQLEDAVQREGLGDVTLRTGDVLLVQGSAASIARLKATHGFLVLDSRIDLPDTRKAPLALATMAAVIAAAATGMLPISVSALIGVTVMLATRCLSWKEAGPGPSSQRNRNVPGCPSD